MGPKQVPVADSKFQLKQCEKLRKLGEDLISRLPNEILITILSLLSLNEAVRTSVLSSRWVNLWKYTSKLNFENKKRLEKIVKEKELLGVERQKYVNWVNSVLESHQSHILKEFIIRFNLEGSSQCAIDKWLEYAFTRRVEKLELDLGEYIGDLLYAFPEGFVRQRSFSLPIPKTSPNKSFIDHPEFILFKFLKELSLKRVNVRGEVIQSLLHSCPLLENVVIHCSHELTYLEICGPSLALKHLEIWYCINFKYIRVSNSNIMSLKVHNPQALFLENVPMLVEVTITYRRISFYKTICGWLSCCISQLETLILRTFRLEKNIELYKFPQLPKLKKLVIGSYIYDSKDESLLGLTYLMRAFPYLQEFVLQLSWCGKRFPRQNREIMRTVRYPMPHLKAVKFIGYYGRISDIELVMHILENAVSLEKIIINPRDQGHINFRGAFSAPFLEREQTARNFAKQQLQGEVPPHIELVIL